MSKEGILFGVFVIVLIVVGIILISYYTGGRNDDLSCATGHSGQCQANYSCVGTTGTYRCVPTNSVCTITPCPADKYCLNEECVQKECGYGKEADSVNYPCDDPTQQCEQNPINQDISCVGICSTSSFGYCENSLDKCQSSDGGKTWSCSVPTCSGSVYNANACDADKLCVTGPAGYECVDQCSPNSRYGPCKQPNQICDPDIGQCVQITCRGTSSGNCTSGNVCIQDMKSGLFGCVSQCSQNNKAGRCEDSKICSSEGVCIDPPPVCSSNSDCLPDYKCQMIDGLNQCVPTLCGGTTIGICPQPINMQASAAGCGKLYSTCKQDSSSLEYSCVPQQCGSYIYGGQTKAEDDICGIAPDGQVCIQTAPNQYTVKDSTDNYSDPLIGRLYSFMSIGIYGINTPYMYYQRFKEGEGSSYVENGVGVIPVSDGNDISLCQKYCNLFQECYGVTYNSSTDPKSCVLYSHAELGGNRLVNCGYTNNDLWYSFSPLENGVTVPGNGNNTYTNLIGGGTVVEGKIRMTGYDPIFLGNYCPTTNPEYMRYWQRGVLSSPSNIEDCAKACQSTDGCDYFSYSDIPEGGCVLGNSFLSLLSGTDAVAEDGKTPQFITSFKKYDIPIQTPYNVIKGLTLDSSKTTTISLQKVSEAECASAQSQIGSSPGVALYNSVNSICTVSTLKSSTAKTDKVSSFDCSSGKIMTNETSIGSGGKRTQLCTSSDTMCEDTCKQASLTYPFTIYNGTICQGVESDETSSSTSYGLFVPSL